MVITQNNHLKQMIAKPTDKPLQLVENANLEIIKYEDIPKLCLRLLSTTFLSFLPKRLQGPIAAMIPYIPSQQDLLRGITGCFRNLPIVIESEEKPLNSVFKHNFSMDDLYYKGGQTYFNHNGFLISTSHGVQDGETFKYNYLDDYMFTSSNQNFKKSLLLDEEVMQFMQDNNFAYCVPIPSNFRVKDKSSQYAFLYCLGTVNGVNVCSDLTMGYPGLSGAPIFNYLGVIVGVYGFGVVSTDCYLVFVCNENQQKNPQYVAKNYVPINVLLPNKPGRYYVKAATGTGKSTNFPIQLRKYYNKPVIVTVPRVAILDVADYVSQLNPDLIIGRKSAFKKVNDKNFDVLYCTDAYLEDFLKSEGDYIYMLDEFDQHSNYAKWNERLVSKYQKQKYFFFVSATSEKCDIEIKSQNTFTFKLNPMCETIKVYTDDDVISFLKSIITKYAKILVLYDNIKMCELLSKIFENSAIFHSRKNTITDQSTIIFATSIVESGITIPNLDCVVDCGFRTVIDFKDNFRDPSPLYIKASETRLKQSFGRTRRTCNGDFYLFDIVSMKYNTKFKQKDFIYLYKTQDKFVSEFVSEPVLAILVNELNFEPQDVIRWFDLYQKPTVPISSKISIINKYSSLVEKLNFEDLKYEENVYQKEKFDIFVSKMSLKSKFATLLSFLKMIKISITSLFYNLVNSNSKFLVLSVYIGGLISKIRKNSHSIVDKFLNLVPSDSMFSKTNVIQRATQNFGKLNDFITNIFLKVKNFNFVSYFYKFIPIIISKYNDVKNNLKMAFENIPKYVREMSMKKHSVPVVKEHTFMKSLVPYVPLAFKITLEFYRGNKYFIFNALQEILFYKVKVEYANLIKRLQPVQDKDKKGLSTGPTAFIAQILSYVQIPAFILIDNLREGCQTRSETFYNMCYSVLETTLINMRIQMSEAPYSTGVDTKRRFNTLTFDERFSINSINDARLAFVSNPIQTDKTSFQFLYEVWSRPELEFSSFFQAIYESYLSTTQFVSTVYYFGNMIPNLLPTEHKSSNSFPAKIVQSGFKNLYSKTLNSEVVKNISSLFSQSLNKLLNLFASFRTLGFLNRTISNWVGIFGRFIDVIVYCYFDKKGYKLLYEFMAVSGFQFRVMLPTIYNYMWNHDYNGNSLDAPQEKRPIFDACCALDKLFVFLNSRPTYILNLNSIGLFKDLYQIIGIFTGYNQYGQTRRGFLLRIYDYIVHLFHSMLVLTLDLILLSYSNTTRSFNGLDPFSSRLSLFDDSYDMEPNKIIIKILFKIFIIIILFLLYQDTTYFASYEEHCWVPNREQELEIQSFYELQAIENSQQGVLNSVFTETRSVKLTWFQKIWRWFLSLFSIDYSVEDDPQFIPRTELENKVQQYLNHLSVYKLKEPDPNYFNETSENDMRDFNMYLEQSQMKLKYIYKKRNDHYTGSGPRARVPQIEYLLSWHENASIKYQLQETYKWDNWCFPSFSYPDIMAGMKKRKVPVVYDNGITDCTVEFGILTKLMTNYVHKGFPSPNRCLEILSVESNIRNTATCGPYSLAEPNSLTNIEYISKYGMKHCFLNFDEFKKSGEFNSIYYCFPKYEKREKDPFEYITSDGIKHVSISPPRMVTAPFAEKKFLDTCVFFELFSEFKRIEWVYLGRTIMEYCIEIGRLDSKYKFKTNGDMKCLDSCISPWKMALESLFFRQFLDDAESLKYSDYSTISRIKRWEILYNNMVYYNDNGRQSGDAGWTTIGNTFIVTVTVLKTLLCKYTVDEIVKGDVVTFRVQGDDFIIFEVEDRLDKLDFDFAFNKMSFKLKYLRMSKNGDEIDFLSHYAKWDKFYKAYVFWRPKEIAVAKLLMIPLSQKDMSKIKNSNIMFSTVVSYMVMYFHIPEVLSLSRIILSCIPLEFQQFVEIDKSLDHRLGSTYQKMLKMKQFYPSHEFLMQIQFGKVVEFEFKFFPKWSRILQLLQEYRVKISKEIFNRYQDINTLTFINFHKKIDWVNKGPPIFIKRNFK